MFRTSLRSFLASVIKIPLYPPLEKGEEEIQTLDDKRRMV